MPLSAFFSSHRSLAKALVKMFTVFLTIAGACLLLQYGQSHGFFDDSFAQTYMKDNGSAGMAVFFLLCVVFSAVGTPRQLLSTIAGYAFGALWGAVICNIALVCGCAMTFSYARLLGRNSLRRRFGQRIHRFDAFVQRHPLLMVIAIRLLPVGNNTLTSLLGGISSISPLPFLGGSFLGYLPQTVIFALLGSGFAVAATTRYWISLALFSISTVCGILLYLHIRRENALLHQDPSPIDPAAGS